jgi:subtilisin family serine protease
MTKKFVPLALLVVLAACQDESSAPTGPRAALAPPHTVSSSRDVIPGRYIIVLNPRSDSRVLAPQLIAAYGGTLGFVYTSALKGFSASLSPEAAAALRAMPSVTLVEEDQVVRAIETQSGATWGLDRIDQRDLPLSTTYVFNARGTGVSAYIIDTGIRTTHSEFGGRASVGVDAVGDGQNGNDCNGHGTHVAGTVGGTTWGVAKDVRLFAVRVLDCGGSGTWSGVIAGIDWVTTNHLSPAVANMSLGGGYSAAVNTAVTNSINSGVTYAIAAGNGDIFGNPVDACNQSPASTPAAITVGATTSTDTEASWSNYGTCVDIYAPGVSITSSWNGSDTDTRTISGTSMATPHVAGASALYLQANPTVTPAAVAAALVSNSTPNRIAQHAYSQFYGTPNRLLYMGFINAGPPPPPAGPSGLVATAAGASQINLAWTDNSTDETSFKIERCTGSGCTDFAQIATAGTNVSNYSNTGLSPSTTYEYRVRASNAGGDSPYSNTAEATTAAPPPDAPPVARYSWTCNDRSCSFDGSASSDDNGISSFAWQFGDGGTGSGVTVTHRYGQRGFFSVRLTVQDAAAHSGTVICQVKASKFAAGPSSGTCS